MRSRRLVVLAGVLTAAAVLALGLLLNRSAEPRKVKVRTGERVVCTYGETVEDGVRVIEVPPDEAGVHRVTTRKVTCARHRKLEALYAKAQEALAKGDTAAARKALTEVLALDKDFRRAAEQARLIDEGEKAEPDRSSSPVPSASGPGPSPKPPPGEDGDDPDEGRVPVGPVASLKGYIPDDIPGFRALPITDDPFALTRDYVPLEGASARIVHLVIVVEQYRDAAAAGERVKSYQDYYSDNASSVRASGRSIYFGTRTEYGVVTWNEGAIAIVAEMIARDGKATGLKPDLRAVAEAVLR